jgi:hypothetical protein
LVEHLVVLLIQATARKTARRDPFSGESVLVYTWPIRLVGWLGAGISLSGAAFMAVAGVPVKQGHALFVILWAALTASQLWLLIESMCTRVRIGDRSLVRLSAWHLPRTIDWNDVVEVRYKSPGGMFIVVDDKGTTIKIPILMEGLGSFIVLIRSRLPAPVYAKAVLGFEEVERGPAGFRK